MTIAPSQPQGARRALTDARMEIAWTVSAGALGGGRSYSSAVLHLTCSWDPANPDRAARCSATLRQAGEERTVRLPGALVAEVAASGAWLHLSVGEAGRRPVVTASFEHGRLVYCTSTVPEEAGLAGGTYDAPTGILELYDAR